MSWLFETKKALFVIICIITSVTSIFAQTELVQYGGFALNTDFPNLITNGDFTAWTGGTPDSWQENKFGDGEASQVGAGEFQGGAGSGAVNMFGSGGGGNTVNIVYTGNEIVGSTRYHVDFDFWANVGSDEGDIGYLGGDKDIVNPTAGSRHYSVNETSDAATTTISIDRATPAAAIDFTWDNVFFREFLSTPWLFVNEWDLTSNTDASWLATSNDSTQLVRQPISNLITGKLYKVSVVVSGISFNQADTFLNITLNEVDGVQPGSKVYSNGSYTFYVESASSGTGITFSIGNSTIGDTCTLDSVSMVDPLQGVSGVQYFTGGGGAVDYLGVNQETGPGGAWEILCCHNGHNYFKSTSQLPDGAGGSSFWFIYWNGVDSWILSTTLGGANGASYWKRTDPSESGAYTPQGDAGPPTTPGDMNFSSGEGSTSGRLRGRRNR